MSTPNFKLMNASRYFVFGMPQYYTQEDIDACELEPTLLGEYNELGTDLQYQDTIFNVASELSAIGWHDIDEYIHDRNYPTTLFAEKIVTIMCGDTPVDITIQTGYTSGYYEAANFDLCAHIQVNLGDGALEYEPEELEAADVIKDNWYDNKGLSKIHAARTLRKIASIIDALKNEAELAFSRYCDAEMCCAYRAFNGEAGYCRTDKRLCENSEN